MVSIRIFSVLMIVILSLFSQAYARIYFLEEAEDINDQDRYVRVRRSPTGHGVTGPVHTYVKTDKHANFKWGVRHHVGHKYA